MRFQRILTAILGLNFLFVLFTSEVVPTHAQSIYRGLIVTPAILEVEAERGKSYDLEIKLQNDTQNQKYDLDILSQTFTASEQDGAAVISDIPSTATYGNWLSYPKTKQSLGSGQEKKVPLQLRIPENAAPGGYYLAVVFSSSSQERTETSSVQINQRVAALLFIQVKGKIDREVNFEYIQVDKSLYDPFFDKVNLSYRLKVAGNTHLKPSGNIFIGDTTRPQVTLPLNPENKIILPNSSRTFTLNNPSTVNVPVLTAELRGVDVHAQSTASTVNTSWPKMFIGKEKVEARVIFVNSQGILENKVASTDILFFPWKSLLLLGFVITLIVLGIMVKKRKTRQIIT